MILFIALALALAAAWLRGGRFSALSDAVPRHGWLALLSLGLQIGIIYRPETTPMVPWSGAALLLMGSYLVLCAFVGLNWRLPGFWLMAIGMVLNLTVMAANGGYMPVTPETLERTGLTHLATATTPGARVAMSKDILLPREATRLWLLSDVLTLGPPLRTAFSMGDVLLAIGSFAFFDGAMRSKSAETDLAPAEMEA